MALTPSTASAKCTIKSTGKSWTRSKADPSFDSKKFVNIINSKMKNAMGFAALMQDKRGNRVLFTRRGWAVSPCDKNEKPQVFTLDTVANWGSVSKIITTATMLNTVQRTPNAKLTSKFSAGLPRRWSEDMSSKFKNVTVAMILQHRAGLCHGASSKPWTASDFRRRLKIGDKGPKCKKPATVGVRKYTNSIGAAARYSTAFLWSPAWTHAVEHKYKKMADPWYDAAMAAEAAKVYNSFAQKFVFKPVGVKSATCNPITAKTSGQPYALFYSGKSDTTGSRIPDKSHACSSGGWAMSTKNMMRVIHGLAHTTKIINPTLSKAMMNREKPNDSYGYWPRSVEGGTAYTHDGDIGKFVSYVVTFPNGHQLAIVSNGGVEVKPLRDAVIEAYNKAYTAPGIGGSAAGSSTVGGL